MPERPPATRFLRVRGVLHPDNRLELALGGITPVAAVRPPLTSPLVAELRDDDGDLLLSHPVRLESVCTDGAPALERLVSASIPLPDQTRQVRFAHDGRTLAEVAVPHAGPELEITEDVPGRLHGSHVLAWAARHPEGRDMWFIVQYTNDGGETWQPVALRQTETRLEIDADRLPGGQRCRFAVEARDGFHTRRVESRWCRVPLGPCRALILAPVDGEHLGTSSPAALRGQGVWVEENQVERVALRWSSSLDGDLGRGAAIDVPLSRGEHEITLAAGEGRRTDKATVTVHVSDDGAGGASFHPARGA